MSVPLFLARPPITDINLGSGKYPLEGWTNVDLHCEADIEADFRDLHFKNLRTIRMSHVLEHFSWRETATILERVRGWLRPDCELRVEVPDMDAILALGTKHPLWFKYVYGDQSHGGEYHLAGFTQRSLADALHDAGFQTVTVWKFVSEHPGREGMPCLLARAFR